MDVITHTLFNSRYCTSLPGKFTFHLFSSSLHGSAVGGGADLVRNVDSTLAWKPSCKVRVESFDGTGGLFEAIAGGLAVSSGLSRAVKGSNSVAATGRDSASTLHVVYARCNATRYLAAGDGLGYGQSNHDAQESDQRKLHSSRDSHIALLAKMMSLEYMGM